MKNKVMKTKEKPWKKKPVNYEIIMMDKLGRQINIDSSNLPINFVQFAGILAMLGWIVERIWG